MAFITPRTAALRWPVLRNFRVITETSPEQLSLKVPPAEAGPARENERERWRGRRRRFEGGENAVLGYALQKITGEIVAIIAGVRGNVSI
jgi:hypothetical protein